MLVQLFKKMLVQQFMKNVDSNFCLKNVVTFLKMFQHFYLIVTGEIVGK
jgi:hypothetical protein